MLVFRARQLHASHAVEQVLEQLAVGRDDVREQTDQEHLEADDHQHGGIDQRLQVAAAAGERREVVVDEPQRDREAGAEQDERRRR